MYKPIASFCVWIGCPCIAILESILVEFTANFLKCKMVLYAWPDTCPLVGERGLPVSTSLSALPVKVLHVCIQYINGKAYTQL